MAKHWLFKEEPSKYSFEDFVRDGGTVWDGVRNNLALKHLRQARKGDEFLYYHTGKERAVVGAGRITSDPYPDPGADNERFVVVDVKPRRKLRQPVTLDELKGAKAFADSPLARIPRLSVMPLTATQWRTVLRKGGVV